MRLVSRSDKLMKLGLFLFPEEKAELTIVNQQHKQRLQEFFTNDFKMGN